MSDEVKEANRIRVLKRARIEHVFANWHYNMNWRIFKSVGIKREHTRVGFMCIAHNINRFALLQQNASIGEVRPK